MIDHVASFVGFVPASRPALVVLVSLDTPKGPANEGGDVAAPLFARIAEPALRRLAVSPDDPDRVLRATGLRAENVTSPPTPAPASAAAGGASPGESGGDARPPRDVRARGCDLRRPPRPHRGAAGIRARGEADAGGGHGHRGGDDVRPPARGDAVNLRELAARLPGTVLSGDGDTGDHLRHLRLAQGGAGGALRRHHGARHRRQPVRGGGAQEGRVRHRFRAAGPAGVALAAGPGRAPGPGPSLRRRPRRSGAGAGAGRRHRHQRQDDHDLSHRRRPARRRLPVGLLGTVQYRIGDRLADAVAHHARGLRPPARSSARWWTPAAARRAGGLVALAGARARGRRARSRSAVFTNLTRDHLDFHGDMDALLRRPSGSCSTRCLRADGRAVRATRTTTARPSSPPPRARPSGPTASTSPRTSGPKTSAWPWTARASACAARWARTR